ncbi:hypothetical protein B0H15DRAFT_1021539 [Mycena belliarum]|uniref:Uncharacterized protein n=1 Tax=Mycena belliarum TaxID=1033014 RepID=A0AAD6U8S3_9AGAR|nr:hypothetical protein B0H15DRAFT_1021539 [Mycena belliae]
MSIAHLRACTPEMAAGFLLLRLRVRPPPARVLASPPRPRSHWRNSNLPVRTCVRLHACTPARLYNRDGRGLSAALLLCGSASAPALRPPPSGYGSPSRWRANELERRVVPTPALPFARA